MKVTMQTVQEDIAQWMTELKQALIVRNSLARRNDDLTGINTKIADLIKALQGADAEYLASALLVKLGS